MGLIREPDRAFRARILETLDQEQLRRARLARVLHDEVAQMLSAVGLQLDILRMDLDGAVPEMSQRAGQIQELLDNVVKRVRDLSYELSPGVVERAGLQLALDMLVGRFRKLFAGNLRLIYDSSVRVPLPAAIAMEKIAEEAVFNAIQHANCSQIEIIVKSGRSGLAMEVQDDGVGFDYKAVRSLPSGMGLLLMEYWATKAVLNLDVMKRASSGTMVSVLSAGSREDRDTKLEGSVYAS